MTKEQVIEKIVNKLERELIFALMTGKTPSEKEANEMVFEIINNSDLKESEKDELKAVQKDFMKQLGISEEESEDEIAKKDKEENEKIDFKIFVYSQIKRSEDMDIEDFMDGILNIIDDSKLSEKAKEKRKEEEVQRMVIATLKTLSTMDI